MPLLQSYGCLCSWLVPHAKGVFTCVGTGGRLRLYRGKWCADEPRIWNRRGAAGIGTICVSSTRRLWLPTLVVYVQWKTGLLVESDWLHPVHIGREGCARRGAGASVHVVPRVIQIGL